jgi:hypothetical protein
MAKIKLSHQTQNLKTPCITQTIVIAGDQR